MSSTPLYPLHKLKWTVDQGEGPPIANPVIIPLLKSKRGYAGTLTIAVKRADVSAYPKSVVKPVCSLICGTHHVSTHQSDGKMPTWESTFKLKLDGDEEMLEVHMGDMFPKGRFMEIGTTMIPLQALVSILNPVYAMDELVEDKEEIAAILETVKLSKMSKFRKNKITAALSAEFPRPQMHWFDLVGAKGKLKTVVGKIRVQAHFRPEYKAPVLNNERRKKLKQSRMEKFSERPNSTSHLRNASNKSDGSGFLRSINIWGFGKKPKEEKKPLLFGQTIEDAVESSEFGVPHILIETASYLLENGLETEGLFRVPGNASEMKTLQHEYDTKLKELSSVHNAAGILKLYIRRLKDPLIPYSSYSDFIKATQINNISKRIKRYKEVMGELSGASYDSLGYLCRFLRHVSTFHYLNKMDTKNLAVVFAPNVLKMKTEDPSVLMKEMPQCIRCMCQLIEHAYLLFPEDDTEDRKSNAIIEENKVETFKVASVMRLSISGKPMVRTPPSRKGTVKEDKANNKTTPHIDKSPGVPPRSMRRQLSDFELSSPQDIKQQTSQESFEEGGGLNLFDYQAPTAQAPPPIPDEEPPETPPREH
ncbi:hypothetical protein AAMO2058_000609700 [Amorphochlora amoebiformis]